MRPPGQDRSGGRCADAPASGLPGVPCRSPKDQRPERRDCAKREQRGRVHRRSRQGRALDLCQQQEPATALQGLEQTGPSPTPVRNSSLKLTLSSVVGSLDISAPAAPAAAHSSVVLTWNRPARVHWREGDGVAELLERSHKAGGQALSLYARRLDLSKSHTVHARRTRIGAGQRVGVPKHVFTADLVVENIEAEGRLRLRLAIQLSRKAPDLLGCFKAHRQSPPPRHRRKRTRSQGPSLRRHYPASTVLRPCPTPARTAARGDVEAATLVRSGPPSITRITLPTCCVQYPGRSNRCMCRLLPCPRGLPRARDGSASASTLSRPTRTSLTLRPVGSLGRPRRPLSRGFDPAGRPAKPLVSFRINRQLSGWNLPP